MASTSIHFDSLNLFWRGFCQRFSPARKSRDCMHLHAAWWLLRSAPPGVWLENSRYCMGQCLEQALAEILRTTHPLFPRDTSFHRLPLGLLLLSRQQLTQQQLQAALAAQRSAGHGRLGEWLQALGFSSEIQITAALARQWSCPVLRVSSSVFIERRAPQIPLSLLEHLSMIPVNYVESTRTLHLAFSEAVDYTALYAIEQMTGCHTEPCFATPTLVRTGLAALSPTLGESEICFDNELENSEISRIIRSYCSRLRASEIRLARCGSHVWARLSRHSRPPLDLILRSAQNSSPA